MSRFDRALGLARSLAVYHLIPRRQGTLRALYSRFVAPGDLVFDVGAHVGNRTRALRALGCEVVAVEPQPAMAATLGALVGRDPGVRLVPAAVSHTVGRARFAVSERTPTVSTLADAWREAAAGAGICRRRVERGRRGRDDHARRAHRRPRSSGVREVDIEGGEGGAGRALAAGAHRVVRVLPQALEAVRACGARLDQLGAYRYNYTPAESHRLAGPEWTTLDVLLARLSAETRHGDVYATLAP
jgi:FkbM family methyltransferase